MTGMKAITSYNSIRRNLFSHPFVEIRDLFSYGAARKLPSLRDVGKRWVWVGEPLVQEGDTVLPLNIPSGTKIGSSTSIRPVSGFTAGCETVLSHGIPPYFVVEDSSPLSFLALLAERAYTVFVLTARTVNA
jgi:hypothetical protein